MLLHQTNLDLSQSAMTEQIGFLTQQPRKLSIFQLMSLVTFIGIVMTVILLIK